MGITERVFLVLLSLVLVVMQVNLCRTIRRDRAATEKPHSNEVAFYIGALIFLTGIQIIAVRELLGSVSASMMAATLVAVGIGILLLTIAFNIAFFFNRIWKNKKLP